MCSYDGPNGIPSCGNKALQVDVLQKEYLLRESILSIYSLHIYSNIIQISVQLAPTFRFMTHS
jgi:hypothetical protein